MRRLNIRMILNILGLLLILNGLFMLLGTLMAIIFSEKEWLDFTLSSAISIAAGFLLRKLFHTDHRDIRKRDGYLIVTSGWLILCLSGTIPYIISGVMPSYTDAFFETMSGFTTTGATILTDIEAMPKSILFWRSLTHWIGGMGIIVLTIAILPLLGIGGMQLFVAEAPGPSPDKLHPRIKETAKRLWYIYVGLTGVEMILLFLGGMSLFDALNHAMSTVSTGGFSTKNASIAYYDSKFIHYTIILFMFIAGTNFTLSYFAVKGNWRKVIGNEEFRFYFTNIIIFTVLTTVALYTYLDEPFEEIFRNSLFQVASIITTTGFATADYSTWASFVVVIFFVLFFTGASAGSTSGGIKMMRHLILIKNSFLELKRQLHPSAVIPVRYNGRAVSQQITYNIFAFILIYILIFFSGSLVMALTGLDFMTALSSVTATLGNIGPGLGSVGPANNFAHISIFGKWFLSFLMLIGRLELFTVLIVLTPFFWRAS